MLPKKLKNLLVLTLLLGLGSSVRAVDLIFTATNGTNVSFDGIITPTTKDFDRYDGTIYIGTRSTDVGDGDFSVCSCSRTSSKFTALSDDSYFTGITNRQMINAISLLNTSDAGATHVACLTETDSNKLSSIKISDKSTATSTLLADAYARVAHTANAITGTCTEDDLGIKSTDVTLIETNTCHVFARVISKDGSGCKGAGIALARMSSSDTFTVIQGNTDVPSESDYAALKLDPTSPEVFNYSNLLSYTVTDMHWNSSLERLYIASHSTTGTIAPAPTAYALVKGEINGRGMVAIEKIVNSIEPSTEDSTFGVFSVLSSGSAMSVNIHKVRHMETSTEFQYLIVNGGAIGEIPLSQTASGNKIYALRIAINSDSSTVRRGDIIINDTLNESVMQAATFDDLSLLDSAIVGSADLPWDANFTCSDMVVIGDAVYVTGGVNGRKQYNNPGVWKSQAMFDQNGLICSWTKWERVYPALGANTVDNTLVFDVDALNGKIWRVANDNQTMQRTGWTGLETVNTKLAYRLSSDLSDGSYCVLDLPGGQPSNIGLARGEAGTTGITKYVPAIGSTANLCNSIAMFGGYEKVIFARTNYTDGAPNYFNEVRLDYGTTNNANYKRTSPDDIIFTGLATKDTALVGAGAVRCLGYAYNNDAATDKTDIAEDDYGYFFAGTDNGLYVYAKEATAGFNGGYGLTDLINNPLFGNQEPQWAKITDSTSATVSNFANTAVSHIVSTTNKIYVVGLDIDPNSATITDKLIEIPLNATLDTLASRVIAESGRGGIPANSLFTGFTILTNNAKDAFYGVLSTNSGIYTTTCQLDEIANLASTSLEWDPVVTTSGQPQHSMYSVKDAREVYDHTNSSSLTPRIFWSIPFTDDSNGLNIYQNSVILQGGNASGTPAAPGAVRPIKAQSYIANGTAVASRTFALNKATFSPNYLDFTTNFWTDGGRRFTTDFDPTNNNYWNKLESIPYNGSEWNITAPYDVTTSDTTLTDNKRIHWIENISGTGQLMVGTDGGVIVLD